MKRIFLTILAPAVLGVLGSVESAHAVPITYTFSGVGNSWLNGITYQNELVTFTLTSDTDYVSLSLPGTHDDDMGRIIPFNPGSTTVSVRGVTDTLADFPDSTDTLGSTTSVGFFAPDALAPGSLPAVGLFGSNGIAMIASFHQAYAFYDLRNPIGPITGPGVGGTAGGIDDEAVNRTTSGGAFYWLNAPRSVTFSAVTSVPEPSGLALLCIGLVALVGRRMWPRSAQDAAV